jgi:hypothetical protein
LTGFGLVTILVGGSFLSVLGYLVSFGSLVSFLTGNDVLVASVFTGGCFYGIFGYFLILTGCFCSTTGLVVKGLVVPGLS